MSSPFAPPRDDHELARVVTSAENTIGVRALDGHTVFRLKGEDTLSWLQGQLTNDVLQVPPGHGVYGLILTTKGRVLSDGMAVDPHAKEPTDLERLLVVPAHRAERLFAHLDAHIIMEDVALSLEPHLTVIFVGGPEAREVALEVGAETKATVALTERGGLHGADLICTKREAHAVTEAVEKAAKRAGGAVLDDHAWLVLRLRHDVPELGADFGENTYPQEAGLKRRAISFTKGCYLGQEVVSMLEHRGKMSKRLCAFELDEPVDPDLVAAAAVPTTTTGSVAEARQLAPVLTSAGEPAGFVSSLAFDPVDGRTRALGYLVRAQLEAPDLHVGGVPARQRVVADGDS